MNVKSRETGPTDLDRRLWSNGRLSREARLIQAHVCLQILPRETHDCRLVLLCQHGAYEVRLVEPATDPTKSFMFWIELFDRSHQISIDSCGVDDLEEASTIADAFTLRAKELSSEAVHISSRSTAV